MTCQRPPVLAALFPAISAAWPILIRSLPATSPGAAGQRAGNPARALVAAPAARCQAIAWLRPPFTELIDCAWFCTVGSRQTCYDSRLASTTTCLRGTLTHERAFGFSHRCTRMAGHTPDSSASSRARRLPQAGPFTRTPDSSSDTAGVIPSTGYDTRAKD